MSIWVAVVKTLCMDQPLDLASSSPLAGGQKKRLAHNTENNETARVLKWLALGN